MCWQKIAQPGVDLEITSRAAKETLTMAKRLRVLEVQDGAIQIEIHDVARQLESLSQQLEACADSYLLDDLTAGVFGTN